jgi:SH3-like domain-containing protein
MMTAIIDRLLTCCRSIELFILIHPMNLFTVESSSCIMTALCYATDRRYDMKARILDPQVKVYSSMDANAVSLSTLPEGSEIEFGSAKRKSGKLWVPITLSTGQQAYIPAETHIYIIREGALMQNSVELHAEPSKGSLIKSQLTRNTKVYILQVVKGDGQDWVRIRDINGSEGYISGETRIRVLQQKTKASGRKNMITGVMWLIAGLVIVFSNSAQSTANSFGLLGYGAILFGAVMLVSGIIQYVTAPS